MECWFGLSWTSLFCPYRMLCTGPFLFQMPWLISESWLYVSAFRFHSLPADFIENPWDNSVKKGGIHFSRILIFHSLGYNHSHQQIGLCAGRNLLTLQPIIIPNILILKTQIFCPAYSSGQRFCLNKLRYVHRWFLLSIDKSYHSLQLKT